MDISPKQLMEAIEQVAYERKIPAERILDTIEAALAAAYRKDFGHPEQNVQVKLNADSGETEVYVVWEIVKEVENPHTQLTLEQAKEKKFKDAKVGEEYTERVTPPEDYGRIAAQTAKQVIIQRIREVEREIVQEEFSDRVGELMTGAVQRVEGRNVFVEIGRAIGVLGPEDQIHNERYYIGQRLRVLLRMVDPEGRAAQLILTRSHPDFVRHLFELEVPEIHAGTVEIKSIAREAGVRTKVAVHSNQEGVDPVGTCVGQRGTRVQAIMAELGDEKIDIVLYDEDVKQYIMNALSPAKISRIDLDEDSKTASIHVADDQLSLAIGRGGQNVRLAGDLTGWQLDIEKSEQQKAAEAARAAGETEEVVAGIPLTEVAGVTAEEAEAFAKQKLGTAQVVALATEEELGQLDGVELDRAKEIVGLAATAVSESDQPAEESAEAPSPEAAAAEAKDEEADAKSVEATEEGSGDDEPSPEGAADDAGTEAPEGDTAPGDEASEGEPADSPAETKEQPADSDTPEPSDKKPEALADTPDEAKDEPDKK